MIVHQDKPQRIQQFRKGATVVETAFVLPVLGIFLAGIMEFGHTYLVITALNGAARQAARLGSVEGNSTADALNRAQQVVGSCVDVAEATFHIKDASIFDQESVDTNTIDYTALPDIELADAQPTQIFVVRIEVPYDQVALLPPFWVKNITLAGQAVMRHE